MKTGNKCTKALASGFLILALAACGGGGGGGGSSPTAPTGIAQTYYPVTTGSRWAYEASASDTSATYTDEVLVTGTQIVAGESALVFRERNPADPGLLIDSYYVKNTRAFSFLGDNAPFDWLTSSIGRLDLMRFDGTFSATPLVDRTGVDVGADLDGDGMSERLDVRITGVVEGYETRTVAAGTFSNTARVRYDVAGTVRLSSGASVPVTQTVFDWRAPDVGMLRQSITTVANGLASTIVMDLRGLSVNGVRAGALAPQALATGLAPADSDQTRPGRPVLASDGNRFLLVSNRQTVTGRQWFGQWVGADGAAQTAFDLSPPLSNLSGASAVAFDGSNYLVLTGDGIAFNGQRVSATGTLLDAYPGITVAAADVFNPTLAFGGGSYLAVYRRSSMPGAILGTRVSSNGFVSAEFVIAVGAADSASPAVAFDGSNFLVAWESGNTLVSPASSNVMAARVSPTGILLDVAPIAVSTAAEAQTAPQVACDTSNCMISWVDRRNYPGQSYNFSPGPGDMYGAFVSRSGQVLNAGGIAIATGISANAGYPGLAFNGTEYLVAWSRGAFVNNPGGPTGIYAARVSPGGAVAVSAAGVAISGPPGDATSLRYVALAASPVGTLVAWLNNIELAGSSKSISGAMLHPLAAR